MSKSDIGQPYYFDFNVEMADGSTAIHNASEAIVGSAGELQFCLTINRGWLRGYVRNPPFRILAPGTWRSFERHESDRD